MSCRLKDPGSAGGLPKEETQPSVRAVSPWKTSSASALGPLTPKEREICSSI